MDRILIILKKENGQRASSDPALGLNTIIFKHVYLYMQQILGERLQDHWSSGLLLIVPMSTSVVVLIVYVLILNSCAVCTLLTFSYIILRLHYVPGGHGGHVSDNREQNGITVRQRRGTG